MRRITKSMAVLAVLAGLTVATSVWAQGTARSLDIQPGGRQNGMGAAGVALGDDATGSTWWNPAALGFIQRPAIQLTYAQLVPGLATDITYNYGVYVQPVEGWGAFALGIVFLSYGQSDAIDESGNQGPSFSSSEFSPALYYGTRILPDFAIGASLKYVRLDYAPDKFSGKGSTFALDLGGLYRIPVARLRLGVNVQNLGPSVTFINEDQASPLPRNVKSGLAWDALSGKPFGLTIVSDFNQSLVTNRFRTTNNGLELRYSGSEAGKGGLGDISLAGRVGYYSDPLGDIRDITYGLGINWGSLTLDYGSIPQSRELAENVNKITLGYRF
jgi:Type IX secretion system protein PorV